MTRTRTRVVTTAAVIAGVFGLTACNSGTSVTTSSTSSSSSTPSSSSSSQTPSSSSSETSSAPSSSSETSTSEGSTTESSPSSSAATSGGGSTATATTATMKFGDTLTVKDTDTTFAITVKDLKVAPDSVYSEANLNRSNGTVYYLDFSVKAVDVSKASYFGSNSVNGLFLKPYFESGRTGAKRLYGDTAACKSVSKKLTDGQSADGCYVYQIPGAKISSATYDDISTYHAIWK